MNVKSERSSEMAPAADSEPVFSLLVPVAVAGAILTALAPFVFPSAGSALGVAIGGALAVANLWAVAMVIRGFLRGATLSWGVVAALKFGALLFVVGIVLKNQWADALPMALGYAAMPLGIVVGQLRRAPAGRES